MGSPKVEREGMEIGVLSGRRMQLHRHLVILEEFSLYEIHLFPGRTAVACRNGDVVPAVESTRNQKKLDIVRQLKRENPAGIVSESTEPAFYGLSSEPMLVQFV